MTSSSTIQTRGAFPAVADVLRTLPGIEASTDRADRVEFVWDGAFVYAGWDEVAEVSYVLVEDTGTAVADAIFDRLVDALSGEITQYEPDSDDVRAHRPALRAQRA